MREQQAEKEGLHFTGSYSHNKEEQKADAEKLRKQGYRAIVCNVPSNPLSRGNNGMGYSVYAEKKYFNDKRLATLQSQFSREVLLAKYNQDMKEFQAKEESLLVEIAKLTNK
jgi:hypothetical protein